MKTKLIKIINNPPLMLFAWLAFLLSPILGLIRLRYIVSGRYDFLHVKGLSTLLFYFPFAISAFVLIILLVWFKEFTIGRLGQKHRKILNLSSLLSLIFLIVSQSLIELEFTKYPNYLYEHYGLTINQMQLMSFVAALQFTFFIAFNAYEKWGLDTIKNVTKKSSGKIMSPKYIFGVRIESPLERISIFIVTIAFLAMFVASFQTLTFYRSYLQESRRGYEAVVGVDYKYIELLVAHTESSDNVKIIHPPQGDKWPAIGNQPVIRFFLFPRKLISGALLTDNKIPHAINTAFFVLIDPNGKREWPKIDEFNKNVIFDEVHPLSYSKLGVVYKNDVGKVYKIDF